MGIFTDSFLKTIDSFLDYIVYGMTGSIAIIGYIASRLEKKAKKKRERKKVGRLTLWIAILGIVVLFFQWRKDYVNEQTHNKEVSDAKKDNKTIIGKTDTISSFQRFLQDSVSRVIKKQDLSIQKLNSSIKTQNNIVEKQKETINQIIGLGFPIINCSRKGKNTFYFSMINDDNTGNLFDIGVTIYDFSKLKAQNFRYEGNLAFYPKDSLDKYSRRLHDFNLSQNINLRLDYEFKFEKPLKFFLIQTITRNCTVFQYFILEYKNGMLYRTYKIFSVNRNGWKLIKTLGETKRPELWDEAFPMKKNIGIEYY